MLNVLRSANQRDRGSSGHRLQPPLSSQVPNHLGIPKYLSELQNSIDSKEGQAGMRVI